MKKISYVIPVYNNAGSIRLTWEAIVSLYQSRLSGYDYEIVFVNDGSRDGSYEEMREVAALDSKVKTLRFTRNFGQIAAITAGYAHASGDAVINMSADLQDPVELTADMVEAWTAGSEVVVAHRSDRNDSIGANAFSFLAYSALRASNPSIPKGGFDFVLMSRRALDHYLSYGGRNRFYQGDILWAGLPTTYLPYVRRRREIGKSQYSFSKKLKLFFDFMIDGSYTPIRFISLTGAILAVLGTIYAVVIMGAWFFHNTPFSGWAPIMVAILLVGGMIMLMLGIVGEYLWRILDEIKAKPVYILDDRD